MSEIDVVSRCSSHKPVQFHWFDGIHEENDPIEVAVERCFDAVNKETRLWNPYLAANARAEFRRVIKDACQGRLVPVDQLKDAGHDPAVPLFEIRWQNTIQVTERDPEYGGMRHGKAPVRMYHSEPDDVPGYFIGHHVHEKIIDVDNKVTTRMQSAEIKVAQNKFRLGEATSWGLAG